MTVLVPQAPMNCPRALPNTQGFWAPTHENPLRALRLRQTNSAPCRPELVFQGPAAPLGSCPLPSHWLPLCRVSTPGTSVCHLCY